MMLSVSRSTINSACENLSALAEYMGQDGKGQKGSGFVITVASTFQATVSQIADPGCGSAAHDAPSSPSSPSEDDDPTRDGDDRNDDHHHSTRTPPLIPQPWRSTPRRRDAAPRRTRFPRSRPPQAKRTSAGGAPGTSMTTTMTTNTTSSKPSPGRPRHTARRGEHPRAPRARARAPRGRSRRRTQTAGRTRRSGRSTARAAPRRSTTRPRPMATQRRDGSKRCVALVARTQPSYASRAVHALTPRIPASRSLPPFVMLPRTRAHTLDSPALGNRRTPTSEIRARLSRRRRLRRIVLTHNRRGALRRRRRRAARLAPLGLAQLARAHRGRRRAPRPPHLRRRRR